jgi:hypothetical protein
MEISGALSHGSNATHPSARDVIQRFGEISLFVLLPAIIPIAMVGYLLGRYETNGLLYDFNVMWSAGRDVAHGHSPFPFVYPAPAAVFMAPLGALPWKIAVAVFWVLSIAALVGALQLLGVRDWRCYGAVFASIATVWSLEVGTITPLLVLCTAAAWRYRDRPHAVAVAIALTVATKIFLWPLAVWLVATRRYRTTLETVLATVGITIGAWAVIGFAGLFSYPSHLGDIAAVEQYKSFSTLAFLNSLGLGGQLGRAISIAIGLAALAAIFVCARGDEGDRRAYTAAVAAALVISPIVWAHYFILIYVPVALKSQRLSWLWLLPLGFWALPHAASGGSLRHFAVGLGICAAVLVGCAWNGRRERTNLTPAVAS